VWVTAATVSSYSRHAWANTSTLRIDGPFLPCGTLSGHKGPEGRISCKSPANAAVPPTSRLCHVATAAYTDWEPLAPGPTVPFHPFSMLCIVPYPFSTYQRARRHGWRGTQGWGHKWYDRAHVLACMGGTEGDPWEADCPSTTPPAAGAICRTWAAARPASPTDAKRWLRSMSEADRSITRTYGRELSARTL
jgi:hypothetical protein